MAIKKRFNLKATYGYWSLMDDATGKLVGGYAKKEDAQANADALNRIRTEESLQKMLLKIRSHRATAVTKRFWLKPNVGHWSVMDHTTGKKVVGYSKKGDAQATADGLNRIRTKDNLQKMIDHLQTLKGYGHYTQADITRKKKSK
jgi:hypothetical protein